MSASLVRSRRSVSSALKLCTALASVTLSVMSAYAQTAPEPAEQEAPPPEAATADDIIVTGSRIGRSGFTAPSPLTVVDAEQLNNAGVTNVGQLAQQVPAFQASFTPATSTLQSQYAGAAFLNLRNLGQTRTLILVNNRRFVPTTTSAVIDTNVVPSSLIERVDVVTGGASAAYGSDAVAGVVNLVLKRNLQGFTGDVQAGVSTHGDNGTYKGSIAWGTAFAGGAGHITFAAEGEINEGVTSQASRGWANKAYGLISNPTAGQFPRRFILPGYQLANASLGGLINSGPLRGTDFGPGGVPRPFTYGQYAGNFQIGGSGVEGSDYIALTVPYKRYSLYSTGEYDFGGVTAFFEASHSYSRGENKLTPAFHLNNITIQPDNAFLPASLAAQVTSSFTMGRFSPDIAYIGADDSNKTDRFVLGFEGEIAQGWRWNIYGEYGHTFYDSKLPDNIITARFAKSVDAVRNGAGQTVCRVNANASTADDDAACVPVNLFGAGSPSQAAIDYFTGTTSYKVAVDERVVAGQIQGDLFNIGDRTVTIAAGAEYRTEKVDGVSDAISQATGFLLGNPKALAGKYNVKEAFGEILVPLLADLPMIKSLEFNGAARVTDYSTSGTVVTWKAGGTWEINDDIRLRATRSRDIRAPNFDELFTNALFRFTNVSDPRNNGAIVSVNIITQGNPTLKPETANTLTAGVVLTPSFIPGFRTSIDYFDIKLSGAIGQLGAQDIVTRCEGGNTALCGFITRNGSNIITAVTSAQINLSEITTSGVDFEMAYNLPVSRLGIDSGARVDLRALATYVDTLASSDGVVRIDRIADVGGHGGMPHWKFNASLTYTDGPFTLFLQDRFVGGGKYDSTYVQGVDIDDNTISGRNYVDMSLSYSVIDTATKRVQLFFNVKNLLDQDPPVAPSSFQTPSQTNAVLYDVIGRQFTTGVRFKF
jgi:iron complex outermembrane receptor protein